MEPLRRAPQQARSRQRVDAILQAASRLLGEVGYEGITTSAIATRAGVAVGSFYQYFRNRDDVMRALMARHLEAMQAMSATHLRRDAIYAPLPALVGRTVDWFVAYNVEHPGFLHTFVTTWVDPDMKQLAEELKAHMAADLAAIIAYHAPQLPAADQRLAALMLIFLVKGMLELVDAADATAQPHVVAHIKRMVLAYLQDLFTPAPGAA